jgi:hypothetical protein
MDPAVIRVPLVPGSDPRVAYGDLVDRGVRGVVLEAFGVGNIPDLPAAGWIPWLRQQTRKGLQVRAPGAVVRRLSYWQYHTADTHRMPREHSALVPHVCLAC